MIDGVLVYDQSDGKARIVRGGKIEELRSPYEDVALVEGFAGCILDSTLNLSPVEDAANTVHLTETSYQAAAGHQVWRR
jgi:hypothetical protein